MKRDPAQTGRWWVADRSPTLSNLPNGSLIPLAGSSGEQEPATLDRVLAIARRNARLLLICAVVVPMVALLYSVTQEKQYTASATLLFRDPGLDEKLFGSSLFNQDDDPERAAATNLRLVALQAVSERTAQALPSGTGLDADAIEEMVSVAPVGESDLISVDAVDPDPELAAQVANTFAEEYIAFRRDADRSKIEEAQGLVQQELDDMTELERASSNGQQLEQQARDLEVLASLQTGNAELVQPADAPSDPSSPQTKRNLALGIVLGLFLGAGLTLLREQLDRRLKDPAEAASVFGFPVLATIPQSRTLSRLRRGESVGRSGIEGDAFGMLRTNLRYFNVDREVKSIVVTSAAPQDGKTTVAWNLALAEVQAGKRVLYLEADLRRPSLGTQLGPRTADGLSVVLAGMAKVEDTLQSVEGVDVLFAGPPPPNPAELIESERMRELVRWGEHRYDRVVIDTPPVAVVADAVPLVTTVSGVLVVVRVNRSRRDAAEHLRDQLRNLGAPTLGIVVNGIPARTKTYYGPPGVERLDGSRPAQALVAPARERDERPGGAGKADARPPNGAAQERDGGGAATRQQQPAQRGPNGQGADRGAGRKQQPSRRAS